MVKQFSEGEIPSRETDKCIVILGGVNNTLSDTLSSTDKSVVPLGLDDEGRIILSAGVNGISKAEDAAHVSGSVGTFILGVRSDSFANFSDTNGDYTPFALTPRGELKIVVEHTSQGTPSIGILKLEDAAAQSGDAGVAILQKRVDTMPTDAQVSAGNDYALQLCDAAGRIYINDYNCSVDQMFSAVSVAMTDTTAVDLKAAGGAGVRHYLTDVSVLNTSATGTRVEIRDGTTVIYQFYAAPTSQVVHSFKTPLRGTAATALTVRCVTTGSATIVAGTGYSVAV